MMLKNLKITNNLKKKSKKNDGVAMMAIKSFSFSVKGEINFGIGCLKELPAKITARNLKKILIVSDPYLEKIGLVKRAGDLLAEKEIEYITFTEIEANPSAETVARGGKLLQENNIDGIVSLGGGSSIDVAKAVAIVGSNGGEIEEYAGFNRVKNPVVPIIAIPTTAGTGSEVTSVTIIKNREKFKMAIGSDKILPECVLLDPLLISTLPSSVAASTGMDALTHAIEAYLSLEATLFSDAIAEKAISLIGANIRLFVANRSSLEPASAMLLGSTFAGIAFSLARLGNVHALSHPLSGHFDIPHGVANALLLPVVLEFNALADSGKYEKIYRLIKGDKINYGNFTQKMLVDEIRRLNEALGLPQTLSALGITKESLSLLVPDAMKSNLLLFNPRQTTQKDVEQLYLKAL